MQNCVLCKLLEKLNKYTPNFFSHLGTWLINSFFFGNIGDALMRHTPWDEMRWRKRFSICFSFFPFLPCHLHAVSKLNIWSTLSPRWQALCCRRASLVTCACWAGLANACGIAGQPGLLTFPPGPPSQDDGGAKIQIPSILFSFFLYEIPSIQSLDLGLV